MGRACLICSDSAKFAKAAELITGGSSDQAVANALNAITPDQPPMSYMAVLRHRQNHIVAAAKALVDAAGKGREVAEQRAQMLAAAEAGDPAAFLALSAIVDGLRKTDARLERVAASAEQDGQRLAVSALSAQQIRMGEMKAKLGEHGGYGQTRASGDSPGRSFQVNIIFPNAGRTETIALTAVESRAIDGGDADALDIDEVADRR